MQITYNNIRNNLKTGDLVFFSGQGLVSGMIKWFTKSSYSHVGMVVVDDKWDMVLLWESTTLSKIKTIHGVEKQGVAIRPLSEVIENYNGEVAVRHLIQPLTDIQEDTIVRLRKSFKGRNYEENKLELFKSAYDFIGGHNEEDLSSLFCSELIAEAYQRMGFLSEHKPSNEYTPADLAELLILEGGQSLTELIDIVKEKQI